MRKVNEKHELYNMILGSPRLIEARQDLTQKMLLAERDERSPRRTRHLPKLSGHHSQSTHLIPITEREADSSTFSTDLKAIEQIRSVHMSVKSFGSIPRSKKKYNLITAEEPYVPEERISVKRKWDWGGGDPFAISPAAIRSRDTFLESVNSIQRYKGTPVQRIRSIQLLASFRPYNHPQATDLLAKMRDGSYLEIQRLVLSDKSILRIQDTVGSTPLHLAVKKYDLQLVTLFLNNGAEVNAIDLAGRTPLYIAARKVLTDIVKVLLEHGANRLAATINGQTPASIAPKGSFVWTILNPDAVKIDRKLAMRTVLPSTLLRHLGKRVAS